VNILQSFHRIKLFTNFFKFFTKYYTTYIKEEL